MKKRQRKAFEYDCAVIGGGPGGLVAALYLSRFKRKVVLIDSGHSRAQWIPKIRNLIGYVHGLSGVDLLRKLKQQAHQYQTHWVKGEAQVFHKGRGFEIKVGERSLTARTVILATGMKDQQPDVSNVEHLRKKGVLTYCPICDGYDHSGKRIGLLVKNNNGLKKLRFLAQFSDQIFAFSVTPFAISGPMLKEAKLRNFQIFQGQLESLTYRSRPRGVFVKMAGNKKRIAVDVLYVGLGVQFSEATIQHLRKLRRNQHGFILTNSHQETSIPRIFAVGDCVNALAQISVAIGQAALAATRIHNTLSKS